MIEIIAGNKGKGKTKHLLDKANAAVKTASGSIVYLDKNTRHMYELSNKVRLIDVSQFPIRNYECFLGFIAGIMSQDNDLEELYLDSFLSLAYLTADNMSGAIDELTILSNKFNVKLILSVSEDTENLPENARAVTVVSL